MVAIARSDNQDIDMGFCATRYDELPSHRPAFDYG
jgi:hypothetical protein